MRIGRSRRQCVKMVVGEKDSDTEWMVACCGEERPLNKDMKLEIKPAEGCQYVTIRDYVSGEFDIVGKVM